MWGGLETVGFRTHLTTFVGPGHVARSYGNFRSYCVQDESCLLSNTSSEL